MNFRSSFQNHRKTYLRLLGAGLILITVTASWLKWSGPLKSFDAGPEIYTQYNNYIIFKSAHQHLVSEQNLYVLYPEEHHDLYKYSPAFALFFGVFDFLPDGPGLVLWNVLNVLVFFFVIRRKSAPWSPNFLLLFLFLLPELITSTQNCQSNALMTGLMLMTYFDLEEDKPDRAACWIVLASFIKVYAGLGALLFLFYPRKMQFIRTGLIASLVLVLLPLFVTPPEQLWLQYKSWWNLLSEDRDSSYGTSIMQILNWIFPEFQHKGLVQLSGLVILMGLLIPFHQYRFQVNRISYLSLILLTLIIFNHKSESATFILAVTGIAIWFFSKTSPSRFEYSVMILVFLFTVLSATDIFPPVIRRTWLVPYGVKVWPCILVYLVIGSELIGFPRNDIKGGVNPG